jgi:hypothetical protein
MHPLIRLNRRQLDSASIRNSLPGLWLTPDFEMS